MKTIEKAYNRGRAIEDVFKLLGQKYDLSTGFESQAELAAVKSFIQDSADAGDSIEQIADKLLAQADADVGVDNFTNTLSPGQYEAVIPAKQRPRTTGYHDQNQPSRSDNAFVSGGSDRKTPDDYGYAYQNPSSLGDGYPHSEAEESYGSQSIGGSGEDRQSTRTTTRGTRYTGLDQRGGQQPDHPPQGRGLSGNYGRGSVSETIKSHRDTELAKASSTVLRPERLDAFRRGVSTPIVKGSGTTVITKGIGHTWGKSKQETAPTFFKEDEDELSDPSIARLEEEDDEDEEARRLEEEARVLDSKGLHHDAMLKRTEASKVRSRLGKSLTTIRAHQLFGKSA